MQSEPGRRTEMSSQISRKEMSQATTGRGGVPGAAATAACAGSGGGGGAAPLKRERKPQTSRILVNLTPRRRRSRNSGRP